MPDTTEVNRRGRPSVTDEARRSVTFTFRGKPSLKRQLEALSDSTGRTISQEIERLIELALNPKGEAQLYMDELFEKMKPKYQKELDQETKDKLRDAAKPMIDSVTKRIEEQMKKMESQAEEIKGLIARAEATVAQANSAEGQA